MLYSLVEAGLRTEFDMSRNWSQVGVSLVLESNNSHEGLNLIGVTKVTKNFDTIIDEYSNPIKSKGCKIFIDKLLRINKGKKCMYYYTILNFMFLKKSRLSPMIIKLGIFN